MTQENVQLPAAEGFLQRLAHLSPDEHGMLSVYLDIRPQGEQPEARGDLVRLRARLHAIAHTLGPRGPQVTAFQQEVAMLQAYLAQPLPGDAAGVALFVQPDRCDVLPAAVPFTFEVAFAPTARLYQLARLLDDHETAVVALIDHQTVRIFALRLGGIHEVERLRTEARAMRYLHAGGRGEWHRAHHEAEHQRQFAREIAQAINDVMTAEAGQHLILLGQEDAIAGVRAELSPALSTMLTTFSLPLAIDSLPQTVQQIVAPVLEQTEEEDSQALADRVLAGVRVHGLGVVGYPAVQAALRAGQVAVLVLTPNAPLSAASRDTLVQLAVNTGAHVEAVAQHEALQAAGGVGALLRYR
jgi:hypothetical protein